VGGGHIIAVSGLLIGLVYGAVGLLSGFCLLSGLRGWWADGDSRLIRTYALALGVASRRRSCWQQPVSSISANRFICNRRFRRR